MKQLLYFYFSLLVCPLFGQNQTINLVIGDVSWQKEKQNIRIVSEKERIQAHLYYVIDLIREASNEYHDTVATKRALMLQHLQVYTDRGVFPENTQYPDERKPCFIDDKGNICAVGYLVQKTVGRGVAERINEQFQYDFLSDMEDASLLAWQQSSGLTMKELATIQPTYGMPPPNDGRQVYFDESKKKYGIKDAKAKIKVRAKYDQIRLVEPSIRFPDFEGLEFARLDQKWGIMNGKGEALHAFEFDTLIIIQDQPSNLMIRYSYPNNQFIHGYTNESLSVFNMRGDLIKKIALDKVGKFNYPLLEVKSNKQWGVLNKDGTWCLSPHYDTIKSISGFLGLRQGQDVQCRFIVQKNSQYGLVNHDEVIIPIEYDSLTVQPYGFLGHKKSQFFLFDKMGSLSHLDPLDNAPHSSPSFYSHRHLFIIQKDNKVGLIDNSLKIALEVDYQSITPMNRDFIIKKNNLYGLYNSNDGQLLACEYSSIESSYPFYIIEKGGQFGLLGYEGKIIIPLRWDSIVKMNYPTNSNQISYAVKGDSSWKLILLNGSTMKILDETFDEVISLGRDKFIVRNEVGFYVATFSEGNLIFINENSFQSIRILNRNLLCYQEDNKFGLWNYSPQFKRQNRKVTESFFDEILRINFKMRKRFLVKRNGKYGIINEDGRYVQQPYNDRGEPYYDAYKDTSASKKEISTIFLRKGSDWFKYDLSRTETNTKLYGIEKERIELLDLE